MVPKSDIAHDRIHKMSPLINKLIQNFQKVPFEEFLCVDEQMCSTKARNYIKQYLPAKPHKWCYKFFVLCGASGYAYNFELYTGQENDGRLRLPTEMNLGASSNVVIRLIRNIAQDVNFKIYFDNYYTSIPLISELYRKGILSLGTVRRNRLPNCKLPDDKYWKSKERGVSYEVVGSIDGMDLAVVAWKDTKVVTITSNFIGEKPISKSQRREKNQGIKEVDCPAIIKDYNKFMGGVDLADSLLGRYKIKIRSKKWYHRVFYHLVDVTVCNAWLLYRRVETLKKTKEKTISLADFKISVSETLCRLGGEMSKRGRPSPELGRQMDIKRKQATAAPTPSKEVRLDGFNHLPLWMPQRLTYKLPGCGKLTFAKCTKCETALCFNKDRNCFRDFHTK